MRKRVILTLLGVLALFSVAPAQPKIGMVRKIDKSSPLLFQGVMQRVSVATGDVNGDGLPEIITQKSGFVFEASTLDETIWSYDAGASGMAAPRLLGFARLMATTGGATHAVFHDSLDVRFLRISDNTLDDFVLKASEPPTEEVGFVFHTISLRSGREVVMFRDGKTLYLIGATSSVAGPGRGARKAVMPSAGYDLVGKYSSEEGERLGYDPEFFPLDGGADFDGDGVDDLPLLASEDSGVPVGVAVFAGDGFDELWRWTFPSEYLERLSMGFHGFADVDGDGQKELFCGDNLVVFRDGSVRELRENFFIRHLMDVDGDGLPDVIGRDVAANRIVALGKATATTVRALPLPGVATLHPAHPNPATGASTLTFTLRQAGAARLDIHDALGRRVRTLRDGYHEAGSFHASWDGSDTVGRPLPTGAYSAVLTAAGAVLRQGIIITR